MQIRICGQDTEYSPNALYPYEESADSGSIQADIKLPLEVERGIILSHEAFGTPGLPFLRIDDGGHGPFGMVFREGMSDFPNIRANNDSYHACPKWGVQTRISFGPLTSSTRQVNAPSDLSKYRLHISVRAGRIVNLRAQLEERWESHRERKWELLGDTEELHFSLRWLDGKFDDWSDVNLWKKEEKSKSIDRHTFNDARTSSYNTTKGHRISITGPTGSTQDEFAQRFARIYGERKNILPPNVSLGDFRKAHPGFDKEYLFNMFQRREDSRAIPTIGYSPVLEVLSNYGEVSKRDARRVTKMTSAEGTEFLFGRVLPAILNYARQV
jgi:hypothetical protein